MKKTGWYKGSQKPTRVGVYERDFFGENFYSMWTGKKWLWGNSDVGIAAMNIAASSNQNLRWRGVVKK